MSYLKGGNFNIFLNRIFMRSVFNFSHIVIIILSEKEKKMYANLSFQRMCRKFSYSSSVTLCSGVETSIERIIYSIVYICSSEAF